MKTVAVILGTRPEIIKLAPVILGLKKSKKLKTIVIATGQHREMAEQAFRVFGIKPEIDLELMAENQSPNDVLAATLKAVEKTLRQIMPAGVVIQGDTTSALGGAISSYHLQIPVCHVEAGLRTNEFYSPFPEEMNRKLISRLTTIHCAPTTVAKRNLEKEGVLRWIAVTGNTVVDSLRWVTERLDNSTLTPSSEVTALKLESKRYILVTGHRRENFDEPIRNLCEALIQIVEDESEIEIVYPVHLNPNIQGPVYELLKDKPRIHLLAPVDYPSAVALLRRAELVITDSGGIQEEAPAFGVRTIITRKSTERPEVLDCGIGRLANLDSPDELHRICIEELELRRKGSSPYAFPPSENPFGDGKAAERIIKMLEDQWGD